MAIVTVKGQQIRFQAPPGFEAGSRKGHTVLLVHGAADNHKIWHLQYAALEKEHTPVALDLPGHYESEGPGIDTAEAYRDFIKDFSDAVGLPPFIFCGHSMGGSMALDFAVHHSGLLKGVIMVGSSPSWKLSEEDITTWKTDPGRARREESDSLTARHTPAHIKEWLAREMGGTPATVCVSDLMACRTFEPTPPWERVTVPVLVVVGDEDEISLEGSRLVAERAPRARLEIVSPAGHPIMVEQPARLNDLMGAFLRDLA